MTYRSVRLAYLVWLTFRIHLEAFVRRPAAYLTATKWWVLRKRVRARAQFAALLASSSAAYVRWVLQRDYRTPASRPGEPPIIALIADAADPKALAATAASLAAEHIPTCVMGPDVARQLTRIADEIAWTANPWLLALRAGDRVSRGAAQAYRDAISNCEARVIYADDDLIDVRGRRSTPHFKPDWNPALFAHHDYVTGACIVRAEKNGLLASAEAGADWDRALVMAALAAVPDAAHVRQLLHNRRRRPAPQRPVAPLPIAQALPLVSVIVPTRNRADLLRTCISGLRATDYPNLELIIADNDSDEPETLAYLDRLAGEGAIILPQPGPFNYATINNNAVATARGDLICLMNNDIEMLAPDWLAIMATQAMRPDVGAVGAQLLYPDGRIQHAGVVVGVGNAAGHAHRFVRPGHEGYFHRHGLPQFVTAVTAACLVVQRERFMSVGGLDEENFAVAFNDVDLCLKLNRCGWQSFYEPRAVLIHHESVSRGHDTDPVGAARFAGELAALQRIWHTDAIVDPFHHPSLSRACEQFALDLAT